MASVEQARWPDSTDRDEGHLRPDLCPHVPLERAGGWGPTAFGRTSHTCLLSSMALSFARTCLPSGGGQFGLADSDVLAELQAGGNFDLFGKSQLVGLVARVAGVSVVAVASVVSVLAVVSVLVLEALAAFQQRFLEKCAEQPLTQTPAAPGQERPGGQRPLQT